MIAIALTIRPRESSIWLELVRHRLRRIDSVRLDETQSLVSMPGIGSILLDDRPGVIRLQAIARDERMATAIRAALGKEVAAAVPESVGGRRLILEWSAPSTVPVPLR